jgi:hypothetical protein
VKKLRTARRAKTEVNGKCEGRKSYLEAVPELVSKIKALYRKPRKGDRKTLQQIPINSMPKRRSRSMANPGRNTISIEF